MDVQRLCLEAGKAIGDDLEPFAHRVEMIKPFLQAEVVQIVGDQFVAQKAGELFVLLEECVFPVRSEDVVPVFNLSITEASFPCSLLFSRTPKISLMRLAVMRQSPISQLRSKILWMGKRRLNMKLRQYSI